MMKELNNSKKKYRDQLKNSILNTIRKGHMLSKNVRIKIYSASKITVSFQADFARAVITTDYKNIGDVIFTISYLLNFKPNYYSREKHTPDYMGDELSTKKWQVQILNEVRRGVDKSFYGARVNVYKTDWISLRQIGYLDQLGELEKLLDESYMHWTF